MSEYAEYVLVLAIVAGAAAWLLRRAFALRGGRASCGCGCDRGGEKSGPCTQ